MSQAGPDAERRRRIVRSALLHAALALGFFGAFFWLMS